MEQAQVFFIIEKIWSYYPIRFDSNQTWINRSWNQLEIGPIVFARWITRFGGLSLNPNPNPNRCPAGKLYQRFTKLCFWCWHIMFMNITLNQCHHACERKYNNANKWSKLYALGWQEFLFFIKHSYILLFAWLSMFGWWLTYSKMDTIRVVL